MCARYEFYTPTDNEELAAILEMMDRLYPGEYKTGEILPGDTAPAVIERRDRIVPVPAVFGFPGFRNGQLLINARSETAAEKKTFAESLRERRAVLPATGFYEWDAGKAKYLFTVDGLAVAYLCGLWKLIEGKFRFVILTREANETMSPVHDRMPVIVGADGVRPWLTDMGAAMDILANAAPALTAVRV